MMARAQWPLLNDQPIIQVALAQAQSGKKTTRTLLADTGAGTAQSGFELLLDEHDCLLCGGKPAQTVYLGGAYSGAFPRFRIRVEIPQLKFGARLFVVGVPSAPTGLDGIACFRFLNRFTYGNFGNAGEFGLDI
jgi:hypothetical protein